MRCRALSAQIESVSADAEQMREGIKQVAASMDHVAGITEENTAATEEMAAQSEQVTQAIENISAISEQTAASSEEVSAAAEETTAANEEMAKSAETVAGTASHLRETGLPFKVWTPGAIARRRDEEVITRREPVVAEAASVETAVGRRATGRLFPGRRKLTASTFTRCGKSSGCRRSPGCPGLRSTSKA